jgi:RNA polymerase sigma-70 factor (ECF subfamily)
VTVIDNARALWLARFVLPHEPALRAWLKRKGTMTFDADDLVQETYAVLASLEDVDHISNPRAYFFRTAYSLALQHYRRARVVSIRSVEDVDALGAAVDGPSPERQTADREELHNVAMAIAALPAKCGEAFRLRKIDGLSQREVAQKMGLTESTVEKHVGKAVHLLMDTFGRGGKSHRRASDASVRDQVTRRATAADKQRD